MNTKAKPNLVGINHIALEVGNIEEALAFYGKIFNFKLRGKGSRMAFIDLGDQFLALFENKRKNERDEGRHFGLVVDDRSHIKELVEAANAEMVESDFVEFYDPWGNLFQIIEYKDVQFSKAPEVLKGMGLSLSKTEHAVNELKEKGMM